MPAVTWSNFCVEATSRGVNNTSPYPSSFDPWGGRGVNCGANIFNRIWAITDWECPAPGPTGDPWIGEFGCGPHHAPGPWFHVAFHNLFVESGGVTIGCIICYDLPICLVGYCYCDQTGDCQPCACNPTTENWDYYACRCVPKCPIGQCWCELSWACVPCPLHDCYYYLNCQWNAAACVLECDSPTCPPGQEWNWDRCRCEQEPCDPGECWCEGRGRCVGCQPPDCAVELGCVWDVVECRYECDLPPACGAGDSWDWDACDCSPTGDGYYYDEDPSDPLGADPWTALDGERVHQAYVQENGHVRYRVWSSSTSAVPDVDNIEGPIGDRPRMEILPAAPRGRVLMVLEDDEAVSETWSDDSGRTWSELVELFPGGSNRPTVQVHRPGEKVIVAAHRGGRIRGRLRMVNGSWGPEYTFMRWTGTALVELAVVEAGFQIIAMSGPSTPWLLVCVVSTGVKNFVSFDLVTWRDAPAS